MLVGILRVLLGLVRMLLALGMIVVAVSLGGRPMGLRRGFVMFRRFVVSVFHVVSLVGRKISAVFISRLNSGPTECQLCPWRDCAARPNGTLGLNVDGGRVRS
jgi:hypothetical protein